MATVGLRVEDRFDGGGNWTPWKARIVLLLEESELWEIVKNEITVPIVATQFAEFKKKNVKAKRISLDSVKDHIIPHVSGKDCDIRCGSPLVTFTRVLTRIERRCYGRS